MRLLLLAFVLPLASCDLQPPKRDATKPIATAPTPAPPPAKVQEPTVPPPGPAGGSGSAAGSAGSAAKPANSDACVEVGVHIANVVIASIEDPTVKAAQEQDRTKLVNRIAETCTRDNWSETARKCFLAGKTAQALEDCGRTLAAP